MRRFATSPGWSRLGLFARRSSLIWLLPLVAVVVASSPAADSTGQKEHKAEIWRISL